jgi:hypothetical protein
VYNMSIFYTGKNPDGEVYPPVSTGTNTSKTQILAAENVTTDSVASNDLTVFVTAKQNGELAFPNAIYDTGRLSIDSSEYKLTNISGENYSFTVSFCGHIGSDSTTNNALITVRINSTGGVGTGSQLQSAAGPTAGSSTVATGFLTLGAFTLQAGESVWLEVSKSVTGTLIVDETLVLIKPIY